MSGKNAASRPLIIFDWDGTLADSMDMCVAGIAGALERMGLPPAPRERMMACNGPLYEDSAEIMGIELARRLEFLRLRTECEDAAISTYQKLFPGIREALEEMSKWADLAIASNGRPEYLETSLKLLHLDHLFTAVQGRMPGKVKAELIQMLLDRMNPPASCVVGDALGDIRAAHACGLPVVFVNYGYHGAEDWREADAIVETAGEIAEAARNLICPSGTFSKEK
ncbi:MAG: HAD-IA family hydrolase [Clostridia bacterium]|nr:HAD-IA family hydrolase [Clostridia bacterium]